MTPIIIRSLDQSHLRDYENNSKEIIDSTDVKLTIISNGTNWWKLEN
jgi:hypothetical protein